MKYEKINIIIIKIITKYSLYKFKPINKLLIKISAKFLKEIESNPPTVKTCLICGEKWHYVHVCRMKKAIDEFDKVNKKFVKNINSNRDRLGK